MSNYKKIIELDNKLKCVVNDNLNTGISDLCRFHDEEYLEGTINYIESIIKEFKHELNKLK